MKEADRKKLIANYELASSDIMEVFKENNDYSAMKRLKENL